MKPPTETHSDYIQPPEVSQEEHSAQSELESFNKVYLPGQLCLTEESPGTVGQRL